MARKNNTTKNDIKKARHGRTIGTIVIIILLAFLSIIAAGILSGFFGLTSASENIDTTGNVALLRVYGVITTSSSNSVFGKSDGISADYLSEELDNIAKDPTIKAVILEINSGGGSGVAADEISYAIEKLKETNKTIVSYTRDTCASAAYWIASETDYIIANKLSFVGSIGVLSGFVEFSGLMDDYNISYERFVAGENKDFGSPMRSVTKSERKQFQSKLDALHSVFISEVAENRNLSYEEVEKYATGMIFTAQESKKAGLIDDIGYMDDAIKYIENKENITVDIREYGRSVSILDLLLQTTNKASYNTGRGIGDSILEGSMQPKTVW